MRVAGIPFIQGRNAFHDADGRKFGIAIHNTSNDGTAEDEASFAKRRTDNISSHFYADNNSVIQSLDTDSKAGHAGSNNGNQNSVAVEITGFNHWSRQKWLDNVAWGRLGQVLAQVCRFYGVAVRRATVQEMRDNPKVRAFYSHDDMRRAWGGTDHTDPGPNFPWDRLLSAVQAAMGGTPAASTGDDDMGLGTEPLTQGSPGYAGHQHDTAWAFTWQAANEAKANTDRLLVAAQADADRDAATLAAINALAAAIKAGGGNVDAAPIVAAVKAAADESRAQYTTQLERIAELEAELADVKAAAEANLSPAERAALDKP